MPETNAGAWMNVVAAVPEVFARDSPRATWGPHRASSATLAGETAGRDTPKRL